MGEHSNMSKSAEGTLPAPPHPGDTLSEGPRQLAVSTILGADREVLLIHNGEAYRLRITANNKLILTK
jgi:hemin uptake protein HemP